MAKIFISYRREDSDAMAGRIFDRLQAHFGRGSVYMDVDAIPLGVDFREHLKNAVSQCDVLLAIIGEKWLEAWQNDRRRLDHEKDFVRVELEAALMRGIPVIPVLAGKASMPGPEVLPASLTDLAYRNAAQVDMGRDFHSHMDRLIQGLENLLGKAKEISGPPGKQEEARGREKPQATAKPEIYIVLQVKSHEDKRELFFDPTDDRRIIIGRSQDCDLCLADLGVSRKHAMIMFSRAMGWALHDLGSTTGVFLNATRIREAVLKPGDLINIAATSIIVSDLRDGSSGKPHPAGDLQG